MNDISIYEDMINALRNSSLRITNQRKEILKYIINHKDHFDADLILEELLEHGVKVSRATIYRTLDVLVQHFLIDKFDIRDGRARFELRAGRRHHDHLICINCGKIVEFDRLQSDEQIYRISNGHNFKYLNHYLQIYGVCPACDKESKA